jgi:type III pantothenate kinase
VLLVIDVGNTQTVIGLYADASDDLVDHWRIHTSAERTADEYALVLQELLAFHGLTIGGALDGVAVASVVPRVTQALRGFCERYVRAPAVVVGPGVRTGMPILYLDPKEVGADRIAGAIGAVDRYGGPVVVVDFGTATTFDCVSAKGEFLGGAIVPGLVIGLDALFARAAGLRRVELAAPARVVGRTTAEAIQAGAVYGYAGLVDGLLDRYEAELGVGTVVATGGLAELVVPHVRRPVELDPWLTLHGLRLIHARNTTDR